jgi:hypothetical protein
VNPHLDELLDRDVLVARVLELADEGGCDAVDAHRHEVVGVDLRVGEVAELGDGLRGRSASVYQLVDGEPVLRTVLGRCAENSSSFSSA